MHGECADDVAVGGDERAGGVGGDAELGDGGVVAQPFIGAHVADREWRAGRHEVAADRVGERRLAAAGDRLGESDGADDDLTIGVDEADQGDGGAQHPLGDEGEAVEGGVRGCVDQPQAAQRLQAGGIANRPFLNVHEYP